MLDIATLWRFFAIFAKVAIFAKSPLSKGPSDFFAFMPNSPFLLISPLSSTSPLSKGSLLVSNLNHQPSDDFSPFSPLHAFLDISDVVEYRLSCPITRLAPEKEPSNSILLNRVAMTGFPTGFCENTPTLLPFLKAEFSMHRLKGSTYLDCGNLLMLM